MKSLFLFDGSALVHRSFHAFSGRAALTSRGRDVGMLFGFLSTLISVIRREHPDRLAIAFDSGAPTFRHRIFENYKANRPPLDEAIRSQLPLLSEFLAALQVPEMRLDGFEADDIIGTIAVQAAANGYDVFIVAGDKDFYQLVTDKIRVYTLPFKSSGAPTIYDPAGVKAKFGVPPDRVTDVLGLMGDSSDNVPGVPGVGAKTAVELIDKFGNLEAALAAAGEITPMRVRQNLTAFAEQARLSKQLVIINTQAPVSFSDDMLAFGPMNNQTARQMCLEYEFSSLISQLDQLEAATIVTECEKRNYRPVINPAELESLLEALRGADLISMDVETTALDPMRAELVGMSFSVSDRQGWYVAANYFTGVPDDFQTPPVPRHRPNTSRELAFILDRLKPIYADPHLKKTGQNLKYDLLVLACYGITVNGVVFDTMIASHLLDASARQHNLDLLAAQHLNLTKIPTSALIGSGARQISMADVPLEKIYEYACEDSDVALRLTRLFQPRIEQEGFAGLMNDLELPLMLTLLRMEQTGVALDWGMLNQLSLEYAAETAALEAEVRDLAGVDFNLNSTQQLADVLFNRLGLPPGRKTKFGWSTDTDELERLAPLHPLPAKLLRYRHLSKLKSTYIDALPLLAHPITGRVHTSYSQTTAATGRLSSNDPNLQNIPIRTEEGGRIRKAFIARASLFKDEAGDESDWLIVSADYSQIELRIMAHLSGDERLKEAFIRGMDIHRATAAWMFGVHPDLVDADMRRQAKEVNFGVLYGMGDFGLAQRLAISRARAKEFIDQYFANFSRVKEFIDELHAAARANGYVQTILGRRRPLPDINAKNFQVRANAERIAINTPIQGTAADLIKKAMIQVQAALTDRGMRARMLMQVHDELVFEAPPEELEPLAALAKEIMAGAIELKVPIEVGVGWGKTWLDAH